MAWTSNPPIPTLLSKALAIDEVVREELAKANPGTIEPTQAVVSDGDSFNNEAETVSATVSVDDYGVQYVVINPEPSPTGTKALVANGVLADVPINGDEVGGFTPAVANGVLTAITLDEAASVVVDDQEVTDILINGDEVGGFTPTVVSNVLTAITLDEATGVVVNGQEIPVEGGTVTIAVVENVVTATFAAT